MRGPNALKMHGTLRRTLKTALEIVAKSLPTPLRRSAPPTKWGITERCQVGPFTPVIKPADSQLAYIVSCCAYLLECFPSRLTEVEITI